MSTNAISDHERTGLWEQIWYSKNGYYDGLPPAIRTKLDDLHLDLLDEQRAKVFGQPLPPRDTTEITKPAEPAPTTDLVKSIHDPSLYSFGEKKLWIGFAKNMPSGAKRGTRRYKYPEGALIHWTAGHRNGLEAGGAFQKSSGMHYLIIDKDGNVGQGDPLDTHGYHGGASSYPGLSGTVSDELVGIENQAAGHLRKHGDKFYPWWDEGQHLEKNAIPASEAVYSDRRGNISPGWYHRFTQQQMLANRKTLCWLHLNNPDVFKIKFIVGHDEVSPGRKSDPGAALVDVNGNPMTMEDLRDQIASDVRTILENRR